MSVTTSLRSPKSLRPYQETGIDFLCDNDAAMVLLRMGGGKTVVSMTAAAELLDGGDIQSVLVVAPKAVCLNTWAAEHLLWSHLQHLDVGLCLGTRAQRQRVLSARHAVTVVNYDNLQWFCAAADRAWDLIIMDEITRFNNGGKRMKAFMPLLEAAQMRWGLTGTLSGGDAEKLYYPTRCVDLGDSLGRRITPFRQAYFTKAEFGWDPRPGAARDIAQKIAHLCYQPDPAVYSSQLPDIVFQSHAFELDDPQPYIDLRDEMVYDEVDVTSAGALVGKLAQVASGFVYTEEDPIDLSDARLALLGELIAEANEPVLIWYWFQHTRDRLLAMGFEELLPNLSRWNSGEVPVAICHPRSGGHGVNAQAGGSRMIWFEHTYSHEEREQAIARLHRQGQTATVYVHDLVATVDGQATVDHAMLQAQRLKGATALTVLSTLLEGN